MDWTSWTGRTAPVDLEALRLLVLVHRLGAPMSGETGSDEPASDEQVVLELRDETRVQCLDHLLAHPATLAYVLMDAYLQNDENLAEQRGALARRVRWLLANERRRYDPARRARRRGQNTADRVDAGRMHRFRPFVWRRWDDALAALQSRGLLRVSVAETASESARPSTLLRYGLTAQAATWLDSAVYSAHGDSGFHAQVCTVIADFLPNRDDVAERVEAARVRHCAFRRDHGLTVSDDAAAPRFHATFRERL